MSEPVTERFERLYASSEDPWNYRESPYEREKYAATLAALPAGRIDRCLEVGCSIGVFTALMAARCGTLVAIDISERALQLARQNLSGVDNVEFVRAVFPAGAPEGRWDLIICSEVLYYLDEEHFTEAIAWLKSQLQAGSCVLAVSWTGAGNDEPLRGDDVHDRLAAELSAHHSLAAHNDGYRIDRFGGSGTATEGAPRA